MTLSRWLRDYLYIPLGGNRMGERRTLIDVFVTMVLGGLWHGAAWTFVFWGAFHEALLAANQWRRTRTRRGRGATGSLARPPAPEAAPFALVCVGWVFFRADSLETAFGLLGRLVTGWLAPTEFVNPLVILTILGMLALQFWPRGFGCGSTRAFPG